MESLIKLEVFTSEYCETFTNTYFEDHLRTAVFVNALVSQKMTF